ncbi:hypothetical protein ACLB2K_022464 [Fragaria x ananassa]
MRNEIKGLFNEEGVWCNKETDIENVVLQYYGKLFTTSSPGNVDMFTALFPPVVSDEMNLELIREFEEEEVLKALKQMQPLKAPDNSLLAFEISHFLKRQYGSSQRFGALKLDMSKAYDRVEWKFLEEVMRSMGFHEVWIQWVMGCIRTVSYSFMLNGEPRESQQLIHGISIASSAPPINHLFFADDSFIFFKAEGEECQRVQNMLRIYEEASGQKVSFEKSSIAFSKKVVMEEQIELAGERVDKHERYLGLPTEVSYSKKEAFNYVMEKTRNKMKNWKDNTTRK